MSTNDETRSPDQADVPRIIQEVNNANAGDIAYFKSLLDSVCDRTSLILYCLGEGAREQNSSIISLILEPKCGRHTGAITTACLDFWERRQAIVLTPVQVKDEKKQLLEALQAPHDFAACANYPAKHAPHCGLCNNFIDVQSDEIEPHINDKNEISVDNNGKTLTHELNCSRNEAFDECLAKAQTELTGISKIATDTIARFHGQFIDASKSAKTGSDDYFSRVIHAMSQSSEAVTIDKVW